MDIRESHSRYEAVEGDQVVGWLIYRPEADGALALLHTIVVAEGRGVGSSLVKHVLDEVMGKGGSVLPYCPFIRAYIAAHPQYLDLVPARRREEFSL